MADAVDLGKTMPSTGLERFAGMALGEATLLDSGPIDPAPARPASGPTDLLAQARVGVSGPLSEPPKTPGEADTADPLPSPAAHAEPSTTAPPPPSPSAALEPPPKQPVSGPPPAVGTRSTPGEPSGPAPGEPARAVPSDRSQGPSLDSLVDAASDPPAPAHPTGPAPVRPGTPPDPGDEIDGYVIEEELGRGGMGRVYRASHAVTGQQVALKMLHPQVSSGRARDRFVNEARMLARLEHPNLVPLLGFIDVPRGLFILMPYVRGITLEVMLRKQGRLPLDVAEPLFSGLCAGVSAVHAHGMLHRDLKPGNVIVQSDGTARLTDFGIAREIGAKGLTATGLVVGTAEYIAPEQANGTVRDDPRSDQYSLGCLLYHMVVGRPPFRHPNVGQLLVKHIQDPPPPPRSIVPELPEAVEAVILKALSKHPQQRYDDVEALRQALLRAAAEGRRAERGQVGAGVPAAEAPAPVRRRHRWLVAGLVLAVAYAVAAGLWWWISREG